MNDWRRLRRALLAFAAVLIIGTVGFVLFGFSFHDALYQTVITVTTVGFLEVEPFGTAERNFTMVLIILGVGTVLYTFGMAFDVVLEGRLRDLYGRRRMDRRIEGLSEHVIVCGWGRVGRAFSQMASGLGQNIVIVDNDPARVADVAQPYVLGDATDDTSLRRAGIERARALVAALDSDAANLFLTVSARALKPDLFIVARARVDENEEKLRRAGADRVVNPQSIGGARMAAFVLQPNVAEFLDVVMHDGSLEFRLEEVPVPSRSPLDGHQLAEARINDRTGALVLAIRHPDGSFRTNPPPDSVLRGGQVLIAIGTGQQLHALEHLFNG